AIRWNPASHLARAAPPAKSAAACPGVSPDSSTAESLPKPPPRDDELRPPPTPWSAFADAAPPGSSPIAAKAHSCYYPLPVGRSRKLRNGEIRTGVSGFLQSKHKPHCCLRPSVGSN